MTYINPLLIMLAATEEEIKKYFKKNNALSPEKAIKIDFNELKKTLELSDLLENGFSEYSFIKKTSSNRYYLDESSLKSQTHLVKKTLLVLFIIIVLIILLLLILSLI